MKFGLLTIILFFFSFHSGNGQMQGITLKLTLQGESIIPGKTYYIPSLQDSISIAKLRFYFGTYETRSTSKNTDDTWIKNYNLIDLADSNSLHLKPALYNTFIFGIDSSTQVSGAMSGDLDPTKGMYWTWQSGYINFKLEGTSASCPTRNNQFQFHLGGYQFPNNCTQQINFPLDSIRDASALTLQLDSFFAHVDLRKTHRIMRTGNQAVALTQLLSKSFYIKNED